MKIRRAKKIIGALVLGAVIVSISGIVNAAGSWYNYSANVPVVNDYESYPRTKVSFDGYGRVNVDNINGSLVAWIESSSTGSNVTTKVSYSSRVGFQLKYGNPTYYKDKLVKLNISTGSYQFTSVSTSGTWSPDMAN